MIISAQYVGAPNQFLLNNLKARYKQLHIYGIKNLAKDIPCIEIRKRCEKLKKHKGDLYNVF